MPASVDVDLLVIGGGAAGVAAALAGARLGARTALACVGPPHGGRTASGPVARAALLACASTGTRYPAARGEVETLRRRLVAERVTAPLADAGVLVLDGRARCVSRDERITVVVGDEPDERLVRARRVVVATGARPDVPSVAGLPDVDHHSASSLLAADDLPYSLVVLGAGPAGCELAQAYARFGAKVTLVEQAARLLPEEHPAAGEAVREALEADGVRVLLGGTVSRVAPTLDGGAYVGTDVGGDVAATHLLVTTGRRPDVSGLGLGAVGAKVGADGAVVVDDRLRTAAPGVLAAGHVTGRATTGADAGAMGALAAANALAGMVLPRPDGTRKRLPRKQTAWVGVPRPRGVQTEPAVARVGRTAGPVVLEGRFADGDLARVAGRGDGSVRVVLARTPRRLGPFTRTGPLRVVGATVVGAGAGDVLAPLAVAVAEGLTAQRLARVALPELAHCAVVHRALVELTSSTRSSAPG